MSDPVIETPKQAATTKQTANIPLYGTFANNIQPQSRTDTPVSKLTQEVLKSSPDDDGIYPYSKQAAHLTAIASAWSYSDAQTLSNIMYQSGMTHNTVDQIQISNGALFVDTNAFLIRDPEKKIAILSFRGTEVGTANFIDVLTDINVAPIEFPPNNHTYVHGGFYRGLLAAWPKIVEILTKRVLNDDNITDFFITGHSLGAALACLTTAGIFLNTQGVLYGLEGLKYKKHFRGLYTFGQPMVGEPRFAKLCEEAFGNRVFRHIYGKDLVPRLPSYSVDRFAHFGTEYRSETGNAWERAYHNTKPVISIGFSVPIAGMAFIAQQFGFTRKLPFSVSIADHLPQNYIDASKMADPRVSFP